MRWMLATLALGGCVSSCDPISLDPCPGHGFTSEIGVRLEGQPCSQEFLVCSVEQSGGPSCTCSGGAWRCGALDFGVTRDLSVPRDFSQPRDTSAVAPLDLLPEGDAAPND
jgi:hypothetical protein